MEIGSATSPDSAMAILNRTSGADLKTGSSSTTEEKDLRTKVDKDEGPDLNIKARSREDAPPSDAGEGVGGNIDVSV